MATFTLLAFLSSMLATTLAYPGLRYLGSSRRARGSSSYYVSSEQASWAQAFDGCPRLTGQQGSLVAIESAEEDREITNWIRSSEVAKIGQNLWTSGGYDVNSGVWRWFSTGGDFYYRNWEHGYEPSSATANARVAFKNVDAGNSVWVQRPDAEERNYYICEVVNS